MKKTTLVIMAAGLGTRYGEGKIKQLDPIGPNGEIIMDYSIYDAKAAGFDKVVFIIRKDIKKAFDEMIGDRISAYIDTDYVYQETENVPEKYAHIERKKPWGTGHAVLACKGVVNEPFAVINADDVYGRQAFVKMHDFLVEDHDSNKLHMAMPGFIVANTLSAVGTVTRGICAADENSMLTNIVETYQIRREDGKVVAKADDGDGLQEIPENSHVSMNMWACPAEFIGKLDNEFDTFLSQHAEEQGAEYLLPSVINELIHSGEADCKLYETTDKWFGVTNAVDKAAAQEAVKEQILNGIYPQKLWN
jgi:UTP-glucose-1-phosphate uridylyltransferase